MNCHVSIVAALGLLAAGCGPGIRPLPKRMSPVLTPVSDAKQLTDLALHDLRRDGVFSRASGTSIEVVHRDPAGEKVLFKVEGYVPWAHLGVLASRSDQALVLAIDTEGPDKVVRFDGTALSNLTERLRLALILARPTTLARVEGLDLDSDGSIALAVSVGGQGGDAPQNQLCRLTATGDSCERIEASLASGATVVFESGRIYLLAADKLSVRSPAGAWSELAPSAGTLTPLDGGQLAYFAFTSSDRSAGTFHLLDSAGVETAKRTTLGAGHSTRGQWILSTDRETDHSCANNLNYGGHSWCTEAVLWTQLVVSHLAADGTQTEIGHLDQPTAGFQYLVLENGSLRLEDATSNLNLPAP